MVYETIPNIEHTPLELRIRLKTFLEQVPEVNYTALQLANLTGFEAKGSCVQLRKAIKELILEGMIIISTSEGFKLTKDPEQIRNYCLSLQHRIIGISNRINALMKNIPLEKQKELNDYG